MGEDNLRPNADGEKSSKSVISLPALLRVLEGVGVATKTSAEVAELVTRWTSRNLSAGPNTRSDTANSKYIPGDITVAHSLRDWSDVIAHGWEPEKYRDLVRLALGVAFLRENGRRGVDGTEEDLSYVWDLIHGALADTERIRCIATQSGFVALPLCSLLNGEQIEELFCLHIWLPDGKRGDPDYAIHFHQAFAQSWVLAGQEKVLSYQADSNANPTNTTHALYKPSGLGEYSKHTDTTYGAHISPTSIVNTGKLVHLDLSSSVVHTRNMSYNIPSGALHTIEVKPDTLHSTLVFFDASRGFNKDAGVAGPQDTKSHTLSHDLEVGITAKRLVELVDLVREWETQIAHGQKYTYIADWENSLRCFNTALNLCDAFETFQLPNLTQYKQAVLSKIGGAYRRFGRYEQAEDFLKRALETRKEASPLYADINGELSVVYRSMNLLDAAKEAVELQYNTAKNLSLEREELRAIGNLGMINYQLFLNHGDKDILKLAIEQLQERVRIARHMRATADAEDPSTREDYVRYAFISEAIAFARLSLCFTASGDLIKAIEAGSSSLEISLAEGEPFLIAMARFFYGRALLRNGQHPEAKQQFTWPDDHLTPAMAFCREPSDEHREYLRELAETGVDMSRTDDNGYTALDYAVFSNDEESARIVLDGIRRNLSPMSMVEIEMNLDALHQESKLRRSYRQLFQEKLRFALLHGKSSEGLDKLRQGYSQALAADEDKRAHFDPLKVILYTDFAQHKRLPYYKENLAREYYASQVSIEFVIFFSYRWEEDESGISRPDDKNHTRYKRMITAAEEFLLLHPTVNRERLGIWIVSIRPSPVTTN